eukprot:CAMPEP_0169118330 /NCGR_PEP_ID=MMETSP1015-20121227/30940_1 /TAXON_ID=342587 /ORGANISM="Karlodinium micrum, Strain CCMP2283" /LENGTH=165 /DNA_ID=CAMNT_0009181085 /DNA_START=57 /DNA_END=554 /DNA_ORIENTATION=+
MAGAVFELAKTGRSKCASTGEPIAQGSPRVGFEIWRMGRRCMTYQTPKSFLSRLAVDIAKDNRSKCKYSQVPFKAGDFKVDFVVGGAKGEAATSQSCSLSAVAPFLKLVMTSDKIKFNPRSLRGLKSLSSENQKRVIKLLESSKNKEKKLGAKSKTIRSAKSLKA